MLKISRVAIVLLSGGFLCVPGISNGQVSKSHDIQNIVFDSQGTHGNYGRIDADALALPYIDGIDLLMDWAEVEPTRGVFNFGPADTVLKTWALAGKKVVVVIRYTNQAPHGCQKQQNFPRWEMERVEVMCDSVFGNIVPNWFNPKFKNDLKEYIRVVADHFAHSPFVKNIYYARVGVGLGSESFYLTPCRRTGPCDLETGKATLVRWGFSPAAWRLWQEEMLAFSQQAFNYTTVVYPLNRLDRDLITGKSIQSEVAAWAVDHGLGLGAQGLSRNFADGPAGIRAIFASARQRNPRTLIQLQTVRPVQSRDELVADLDLAHELGTNAVEWYVVDARNPEFGDIFRAR